MTSNITQFEPLDWSEQDQKWSWPPQPSDGKPLYPRTIEYYEDILNVLARGPIEDTSGHCTAMLQAQVPAMAGVTNSTMVKHVTCLENLGLVDRTVHGKRTKRIALAVPQEQLPDHIFRERHAFAKLTEPVPAPVSPEADTGLVMPTDDAGLAKLADYIMDRAVQMATAAPANTADLEAEVVLHKQRADKLVEIRSAMKQDLDKQTERAKTLRMQLDEAEHKVRQLERNLQAALQAARDLAQRSPSAVREDTRKGLERLMQNRDRD